MGYLNKKRFNFFRAMPAALAGALLAASCASIGNPSGGPRDEDPPIFVRANPAPGSVNVSRQRIDIEFDELVNVKDAFSKVVVSPPSKTTPRVSTSGRRVTVFFPDSLLPNTTYTIDFGNAIEDNNEGNKLQGFSYTFSTGPEIDTLRISGMVLSADGLEPQQGMLVGVYSNLSDTAFSTLPFERMAKTDDRGRFTIRGLAPGEYRLFAVNDVDNDYHRKNPDETAAFYDFVISPTTTRVMASDTVFNLLTGGVDSVLKRERTRYLPNDILLRSFDTGYKPQYLLKYERKDSTKLSFIFNAPSESLPSLEVVGRPDLTDWWVLEKSVNNDTLTYWITDQSVIATDSLRIATTYLRTDSAKMLSAFTDTLRFFLPKDAKKQDKKKDNKKKDSEEEIVEEFITPLTFRATSSTAQEVYLPVFFEFETPLSRLDSTAFTLETQVDSVWFPVKKEWKIQAVDSLNPRKLKLEYPWDYSTEYRVTVDSLAATGIYGLSTKKLEHQFKTKSEEDYSTLNFVITNFIDTVPAFVELLSSNDTPVRRAKVVNHRAEFKYLPPGKYYARIYEDFNGNMLYDPGDPDTGQQPDVSYYYPKLINLKKNWERTEDWNVFATAVDLMKPENIKKNKPEADKRNRNRNRQTQEEEDDEDYFDPTRNPFDPNDRGRRNTNNY